MESEQIQPGAELETETPKRRRGRPPKNAPKPKHYLNNAEFTAELSSCIKAGRPSNLLISMFEKIAEGRASASFFGTPHDKEHCVAFAVSVMAEKYAEFDISRGTAFAWFSTVALNGIRAGWNELQRGMVDACLETLLQNYEEGAD